MESAAETIKTFLDKVPGIQYAFIYGFFPKNPKNSQGEVDVMVVGGPQLVEMDQMISKAEGELNYPGLQGEGFEITGRLEVDLTHSHSFVRHSCAGRNPVSFFSFLDSRFHGNDSFDVIVFTCLWSASFQSCEGYVTKDWPTISQIFPSPQGEGFPPSPKGDIKRKRHDSPLDPHRFGHHVSWSPPVYCFLGPDSLSTVLRPYRLFSHDH